MRYIRKRNTATNLRLFIRYGLSALFAATVYPAIASPIDELKQGFSTQLKARAERLGIDPAANAALMAHTSRMLTPRLEKMGDGIHAAIGYDYSNYAFIEAEDGVIVIDTGWFEQNTANALRDYRKITDKPIRAIIYTHTHNDHVGASRALVPPEKISGVQVIGPRGWKRNVDYEHDEGAKVWRRAYSQFGAMLPEGPHGTVSTGLAAPLKPGTRGPAYEVTREIVADMATLDLAGTRLVFVNAAMDIPEGMLIYSPDSKTLFVGDLLDGTFVPMATARWEPTRSARAYMDSLDLVLETFPDVEHLVAGHGVTTSGNQQVLQRLRNARDLVKYTADVVQQSVSRGLSPDQILENLQFPAHLAGDPHLQPFYHRKDWIIRGMYTKLGGWITGIDALTRLTDAEEARRLVALLGGDDAVLQRARSAVGEGEYRWAVTLASYVLSVAPDNSQARQLKKDGLLGLAYETSSANERNYALTEVVDVPWSSVLGPMFFQETYGRSVGQILSGWPLLFDINAATTDRFELQIRVEEEPDGAYFLTFRNGVIDVYPGASANADVELTMNKDTLARLTTGEYGLSQAREQGVLKVEGNETVFRRLDALQI